MPSAETVEHEQVRVFVVDDHEFYRTLAVEVIAAAPGFTDAGSAASWLEAEQHFRSADALPDLVLMDVNLGDENGIAATAQLVRAWPTVTVVLISTLAADELPPQAATCGAAAFLSKSELGPETIARSWRVSTGAA